MKATKEEFIKTLDDYYDKKISLNDFIYNIKLLHRIRFADDSKDLINVLHPAIKDIMPKLIEDVESLSNLVFYGILTNKNIEHYRIRFQYLNYSEVYIEFSVGNVGSNSSTNEYYVSDGENIHLCMSDGSCQAVYGECEIKQKNLYLDLLSSIISFEYDRNDLDEFFKYFKKNYGKLNNIKLFERLNKKFEKQFYD